MCYKYTNYTNIDGFDGDMIPRVLYRD
jgi:hypothetical protein